jgi:hypothetical protein
MGHLEITVQSTCANAEDMGFEVFAEEIIASLAPKDIASVQARTFFSIPKPIFGKSSFASCAESFCTSLSSI